MNTSKKFSFRQIPPLVVGLLYLLLIPTFSLAYWSIWEDFYQATSKYERATFVLEEEATRLLERDLEQLLRSRQGYEPSFHLFWVKVRGLTGDANKINFISRIHFGQNSTWTWPVSAWTMRLGISDQGNTCDGRIDVSDMPEEIAPAFVERNPHDPWDWWPNKVFIPPPEEADAFDSATIAGQIVFPIETCRKLKQMARAQEGFPEPVSGGFERFLYLSTVTITTLGYGDIVPLTDRARLLVALESILGVILAGLFINSVTARKDLGNK